MRLSREDTRRSLTAALVLCLIVLGNGSGANPTQSKEQVVLDRFLYSKDIGSRKVAFEEILVSDKPYRDLVLAGLRRSLEKPDNTPDSLIYLAAYIKDPRYLSPLAKLINNAGYSGNRCIYSCPIVFSLAVYQCFAGSELPTDLNSTLTPVKDLDRVIRHVRSISVEPEMTSKLVHGPGIDSLVQEIEKLPISEVMQIAGPNNNNARKRMAAAFVLQARITDPRYLSELYWLAVTALNDASGEYRSAIYSAIYRVETVKLRQSSKQGLIK